MYVRSNERLSVTFFGLLVNRTRHQNTQFFESSLGRFLEDCDNARSTPIRLAVCDGAGNKLVRIESR